MIYVGGKPNLLIGRGKKICSAEKPGHGQGRHITKSGASLSFAGGKEAEGVKIHARHSSHQRRAIKVLRACEVRAAIPIRRPRGCQILKMVQSTGKQMLIVIQGGTQPWRLQRQRSRLEGRKLIVLG